MKDIRCLLGFHKWTRRPDPEGAKIIVCGRCRKEDHSPDTGMLPLG